VYSEALPKRTGKAPAALILFFHPILEDIAAFYGMGWLIIL